MLKFGRIELDFSFEQLMLKDSLFMEDADRVVIAKACASTKEDRIIVTHGTGTMVETAKVISELVQNKTVVLTGAMIPYTVFGSDSLFNIGNAIAFVQTLPHGVYIAMNGQYFNWNNVHKNTELGRFEELVQS
jgi:L-asparaginase